MTYPRRSDDRSQVFSRVVDGLIALQDAFDWFGVELGQSSNGRRSGQRNGRVAHTRGSQLAQRAQLFLYLAVEGDGAREGIAMISDMTH